jgi:type VI secretion system protein ImpA
MPSPPLLEFDALLQPIPGDNPAGDGVPFTAREKLEEARKEIDPEDFAPNDPMRPAEPKRADWAAIERLTKQVLTENCKDLLTAGRLTEALTRRNGFAGLRDGLQLMRRMIEECWDRILPSIEDGDLEMRSGPFNWLDEPDRGVRFPQGVRQVPLVQGGDGAFSWFDWRQSQDGKGTVTHEMFEKALMATPRERLASTVEDLDGASQELRALVASLGTKLGEYAPGMTSLNKAVEESRDLARQLLQRKGGAADEAAVEGGAAADGVVSGNGHAAAASSKAATRDDVYRRLAELADTLARMEPHSPIPYFIKRAVSLGAMPFPMLMRALIREQAVLMELNREMGIEQPAEGTAAQ